MQEWILQDQIFDLNSEGMSLLELYQELCV